MNIRLPEKEKINKKRLTIYIVVLIICIIAITIVIGVQILGNDVINNLFGINKLVKRTEQEEAKLKVNFENIFNNELDNNKNYQTQKIDNNKDIVYTNYSKEDKTDKYEAAIIKINGDGEIEKEVTFSHDDISKFKDSVYLDDKIVVAGVFGKKKDDVLNASGLLVTYDINLEKVDEKFYTNNKTYSFTKIINNDGKYLAIGNTNSKINNKYLKTNGLDFYPVIEKEA